MSTSIKYDALTNPSRQPTASVCSDTYNSTYTPLLASATYTGVADDVFAYATVTVAVATDQNGQLRMQFSADGTNILATTAPQPPPCDAAGPLQCGTSKESSATGGLNGEPCLRISPCDPNPHR